MIKSQLRELSTQRCWSHGPHCAYNLCLHVFPPHLKEGGLRIIDETSKYQEKHLRAYDSWLFWSVFISSSFLSVFLVYVYATVIKLIYLSTPWIKSWRLYENKEEKSKQKIEWCDSILIQTILFGFVTPPRMFLKYVYLFISNPLLSFSYFLSSFFLW